MRYCAVEELLSIWGAACNSCETRSSRRCWRSSLALPAHGIAGNRYFDGTMTFDDPSVADEAILPYWANPQYPTQGSNVAD